MTDKKTHEQAWTERHARDIELRRDLPRPPQSDLDRWAYDDFMIEHGKGE